MALRVQPGRPPRAGMMEALAGQTDSGLLLPLAHGSVGDSYYVVCPAPPGPALSQSQRPWSEAELLEQLLRPAAQALAMLAGRGVTHRAIRLENLFRAHPGAPVVLGAAWAAPPASLQSAIYEPPYVGQCSPVGRGNGNIADDVYALAVVMLALATGRVPMAGLDDASVLRQKLDVGSFQALAGGTRPPPLIADLARNMLAEDPEHRPPPDMLADPVAARAPCRDAAATARLPPARHRPRECRQRPWRRVRDGA